MPLSGTNGTVESSGARLIVIVIGVPKNLRTGPVSIHPMAHNPYANTDLLLRIEKVDRNLS